MEAKIPAKSMLLFSKMIGCLSKIGEDLFLEATDQKLVLRTLNQTRSAFFCFSLQPHFFESYRLIEVGSVYRCKLVLKSCVAVVKTNPGNVEKCIISVRRNDGSMKFELQCRLGVRKTYELDLEESDPLQAVYSKENCPNRMQVMSHTLNQCLQNFPGTLEEITFILGKECLKVKSYFDNQKQENLLKKLLLTELTLNAGDFEAYDFNSNRDVDLTFCLKDMKAILSFCEKLTTPISFFMDDEGKPILMSVSMPGTFEADFVLATLLDPLSDKSSQSQSEATPAKSTNGRLSDTSSSNMSTSSSITNTNTSNMTSGSTSMSMDISQSDSSPATAGLRVPKRKAPTFTLPDQKSPTKQAKTEKKLAVDDEDGEDVILWGKDIQSNHGGDDDSQ
jgi:hypothetical protein